MSGFPYIFTFYSYKGGVGRSMALLNVAYTLAGRGRHVLMIDLDMEAPGVSGFLDRHGELGEPEPPPDLDTVYLLDTVDLLRRVLDSPSPWDPSQVPVVQAFTRPVDQTKLQPLAPKMGNLGRLDVICADLARDYWKRLAKLELASYEQDPLLQLSAKLWSYLKAQRFPCRPLGLEDEDPIESPYDYVLVDSRTGITETGGLCVGPLADRLVVVTGLNDQNVQGTLDFLKLAGIEPQKRGKDAKQWDDADDVTDEQQRSKSLGPKPTLIVASPLPAGEISFKEKRLEKIAEVLGPVAARLSYHPQMALIESLFVRDHPSEYLSLEYHSLADELMAQVGDLPAQLAKRSTAEWEAGDHADAVSTVLRLASHEANLGQALLVQLGNVITPATEAEFMVTRRLHANLERVLQTQRHEVLNNWGTALANQAKTKSGEEADRLFSQSYERYAKALEIKPDKHEALSNWGTALADQARTKSGKAADRLFSQSYERYAKALEIKPDLHEALYNWGNALADQAKTKSGEEADRLFETAREHLMTANAIAPGSAWFNLACLDALTGDVDSCLRLLWGAKDQGKLKKRQRVLEDEDFAGLLEHPEMQRLLKDLD